MDKIYARASVSISDLKKNPSRIINEAEGAPVAILNHNKPSAYLIPAEAFEALMERFEDYNLAQLVKEREKEPTVKVSLDDLFRSAEGRLKG
jgi:antitoxin StbD